AEAGPATLLSIIGFSDYCSDLGAPTGHTPAHAPHSMHSSGLITYLPSSSSLIALTGHSPAHAPHPMHSSLLILYAITTPPCFLCYNYTRPHNSCQSLYVFFINNLYFQRCLFYRYLRMNFQMKIC